MKTNGKTIEPFQILHADDDEDDNILITDAFKETGLNARITWVEDGEKLLDYLSKRGHPDLILLDLNMPRKDGFEALQEIKSDAAMRPIPIIAMTTSASKDDIQQCYDLGVNSYIKKPENFDRLLEVANIISKYWFSAVELPEKPEKEDMGDASQIGGQLSKDIN
ncbi:response regulator [Candidatus Magnetominusculus dajiuhuensis]|uniref:response regulator n=1 Tax=Candidatus Magnetominusculus dajiuhuensis TaxID=3137712 RepID=UPI003B43BE32